jgi:hypothetical protein
MRRLEEAIVKGLNHVFETTLGDKSVTEKILQATKTHDVLIWFCGLSSPELHIGRVNAGVAEAAVDGTVPDPVLVLDMENGQVIFPAPDDLEALQRTPAAEVHYSSSCARVSAYRNASRSSLPRHIYPVMVVDTPELEPMISAPGPLTDRGRNA